MVGLIGDRHTTRAKQSLFHMQVTLSPPFVTRRKLIRQHRLSPRPRWVCKHTQHIKYLPPFSAAASSNIIKPTWAAQEPAPLSTFKTSDNFSGPEAVVKVMEPQAFYDWTLALQLCPIRFICGDGVKCVDALHVFCFVSGRRCSLCNLANHNVCTDFIHALFLSLSELPD